MTAKTFPDDTWRDVVHDYWTVVRWHFLWRPCRAFFRWLSRMGLDDLAAVLAAPELSFRCTCGALVREWRHWERSLRCDDCASLAVECPACGETWHTCEAGGMRTALRALAALALAVWQLFALVAVMRAVIA